MEDSDTGKILTIIGFILFMVPFFTIPLLMMAGPGYQSCAPLSFVIAVIGFILIFIGNGILGQRSLFHPYGRQRIPPVQYPSKSRKEEETIEKIECPDCGASPRYIDDHGICNCEYCGTKYKVR